MRRCWSGAHMDSRCAGKGSCSTSPRPDRNRKTWRNCPVRQLPIRASDPHPLPQPLALQRLRRLPLPLRANRRREALRRNGLRASPGVELGQHGCLPPDLTRPDPTRSLPARQNRSRSRSRATAPPHPPAADPGRRASRTKGARHGRVVANPPPRPPSPTTHPPPTPTTPRGRTGTPTTDPRGRKGPRAAGPHHGNPNPARPSPRRRGTARARARTRRPPPPSKLDAVRGLNRPGFLGGSNS